MSETEKLVTVGQTRLVRLAGADLIAYRKKLHKDMEMATGGMQDAADRLGDPKYPNAEKDLKNHALRFRDAGIAHMGTICKDSIELPLPNDLRQARAAQGVDDTRD